MRRIENINAWQAGVLFFSYLSGSSMVWIPDVLISVAGNGAWLAILLSSFLGGLLVACILYLSRHYPGMSFIEYSRKSLGGILTIIIAVPFITMLFLMLTNIVLGMSGFFVTTMLRETPPYVFNGLLLFISALAVHKGIEVMARMFTLLVFIMCAFVLIILLLYIPHYRPDFLFPVLPDGLKPLLHGTYITSGFPYSEIVLFAFILPYISKDSKTKLGKFLYMAFFMNIVTLTIPIICSIMALGPLAGETKYSVFQIARLIEVGSIIERIESVIGIVLIIGSLMKATIVLLMLSLCITHTFKLQDDRAVIFPAALISFLLSVTMYVKQAEFTRNVTEIWPLYIGIVGVLPILLITVVTFMKNKFAKRVN